MYDLNEIQCYVSAVEFKSFTAAANALGLPKSTVSRKIKNLEDRLKMTLLIRTTRSLRVTDIGEIYYKRACSALREIEDLERELLKSSDRIDGTLRITAPATLAISPLNNIISTYMKKHSDVNVDVHLTDRVIDLVGERFDFGIRAGKQQDSSLRMRKIFSIRIQIVASPSYFPKLPRTIDDINEEDFLRFSPNQISRKITFKNGADLKVIKPRGRVSVNDSALLKELIKAGVGIGVMPAFMIHEELEKGELITLFPEWTAEDAPMYLVYPAQKYISPKMNAFLEHIGRSKPLKI